MFRILLPTDFSSNAMHAATYAVQLFGKSEATCILMHAQYDSGYVGAMGYSMGPELLKGAEDGLALTAKRFAETTGATSVESHLLFGLFDVVVEEFVREQGADVVVMGKRGETGSALFGSNTTDVIRSSSVPVLAVPDMARLRPLHRILLAADQDAVLPANFALLRTIALRHRAEVLVTHVEMDVPAGAAHRSESLYELALQDVPLTGSSVSLIGSFTAAWPKKWRWRPISRCSCFNKRRDGTYPSPSQWTSLPISRIMLAHDGGRMDRSTLKPLIDLAKRTSSEVVLAHVRDNTVAFDQRADRKQIAELL